MIEALVVAAKAPHTRPRLRAFHGSARLMDMTKARVAEPHVWTCFFATFVAVAEIRLLVACVTALGNAACLMSLTERRPVVFLVCAVAIAARMYLAEACGAMANSLTEPHVAL